VVTSKAELFEAIGRDARRHELSIFGNTGAAQSVDGAGAEAGAAQGDHRRAAGR